MIAPERSHVLISKVQADSADRLADELRHMANAIERGELSTGCTGSPSGGGIYSYKINPEQTHDKYFADIAEILEEERRAKGSQQ